MDSLPASESGELMLWDAAIADAVHSYEKQPDVVTGMAFAPTASDFMLAASTAPGSGMRCPKLDGSRAAGDGRGCGGCSGR